MQNFVCGFITPPPRGDKKWSRDVYADERKAIKEDLKDINILDVEDSIVKGKLRAIAKKIIDNTIEQLPMNDVTDIAVPKEGGEVGTTLETHELSGFRVWEGTYGAAMKVTTPILTPYTVTSNPKHVGISLILKSIQSGKYSTSEVGDYASALIGAYRNRLIFSTLEANASYQSSGMYYVSGATLSTSDFSRALASLEDNGEPKVIIGRRKAVVALSNLQSYSNTAANSFDPRSEQQKREWETVGRVGQVGGIPVVQINSFTDATYGTVYPCNSNDLWIFSTKPLGKFFEVQGVEGAQETDIKNGRLNIYLTWDDGFAIFHPNRACRIHSIT